MFGSYKKSSRLVLWEEKRRAARQAASADIWHERRQLIYRLSVAAITVLVVSLIMYAGDGQWGPPFAFREGQVFPRGVRAKEAFSVVDDRATLFKREEVAIFRLNSQPLEKLQDRLTQLFLAAYAGSINRLDADTLRYWALSENELKSLGSVLRGPPQAEAAAWFAVTPLSTVASVPPPPLFGAAAVRKAHFPIEGEDDLRSRIAAAFDQLKTGGILDDKDLAPTFHADKVTVRESEDKDREAVLQQVRKSRLLGNPPRDKGLLYLHFFKAFRNEAVANRLYDLVVGSEKRPSRLPTTLVPDADATRLARRDVVQTKEYKRGDPLIEQGIPVEEKDLALLKEEHQAYLASLTANDHFLNWLSLFVIAAMVGAFSGLYVWRFMPNLRESFSQLIGACGLITIGLAAAVFLSRAPFYATIVPLTMTAMALAIAFDQSFALVVSFGMALVTVVSLGTDVGNLTVLFSGLAVAVLLLRNVRTRVRLVQVGFYVGLVYAAMTLAEGVLGTQTWSFIGYEALRRFFWGLISGVLLSGILPFLEKALGVVTDISLLELADVSHPLLQELVRRAPGTYTHSMTVATLAESAAEAVGANPLLSRVGACFHDIGKMLKPHYFIENQAGENRHEGLAPAMSTLVIIGHVKDGVELARQHKLPQCIVDFIQQHHGTTLIEYFYHEATKNMDPDEIDGELEAAFRYPGPKPQNRENGVVMLADAVEGAARALSEPAPSSIRKLVHDIFFKRLLDGQFDESGLTLSELHIIEESLCKSLIALYHARVKYPEAKTAG